MLPPHKKNQITTEQALQLFQSDGTDFLERFWEFFSLISLGSFEYSKELYEHLAGLNTYTWQLPMVDIGRSKFLSIKGKLFESHETFKGIAKQVYDNNLFPTEETGNEIHAFLLYEQGLLAGKVDDFVLANYYFNTGIKLTGIINFALAFRMQIEAQLSKQNTSNLPHLEVAIQNIKSAGVPPLACTGFRTMGTIYRESGDYKTAYRYFRKALLIAQQNQIELLERQNYISLAVLNEKLSDYKKAREFLDKATTIAPLDPIIPTKYEIMAVIEAKQGNMRESVRLVKQALEISLQLDHIVLIPDECLYLGETYENHFKDLDQAEHYYKIGYDHSIRYAEHGISLTGDRKKVVDAYLNLITNKHESGSKQKTQIQQESFSYAQGKTWKEIKETFHSELLRHHTQSGLSSKLLAKRLSMPPTTLYSLQDRLKKSGYLLSSGTETEVKHPHDLQAFIIQHETLSWKEINQIFEREIMHYLYEKYGYNKHRMASILKLSYPSIINKTRQLTQVDVQFLPN